MTGVASLMEVEYDRGPRERACIINLAVELGGSCRRSPMNPAKRVAHFIRPDACDPRGIFVESMRQANIADRSPGGQVVTLQGHQTWIDHQILRVSVHPIAAM